MRIDVSDTGIGIPLEKHDELFQYFNRLGADKTSVPGVGVGLALSRRLVELMGGSIGVESVPGVGSTFSLTLPSGATDDKRKDALYITSETGEVCILYVAGNNENRDLVRFISAQRADWRLIEADSGSLGITAARSNRPDIILADMHLPDMSAFDMMTGLNSDAKADFIPVLVLSSDATPAPVGKTLTSGFTGYLAPPFTTNGIWEAVDNALRQRELQAVTIDLPL